MKTPCLIALLCSACLLACERQTDSAESELIEDWQTQQGKRQDAVDSYLTSSGELFAWFKDSPLGFKGVPFVLLKVLMEMYPDIWTDSLGMGTHPDDYDADGAVVQRKDRTHALPYGMAYEDPEFSADNDRPTRNAFFSCAACHTGRVLVDGKIKFLYGAPNTEIDPQLYDERMIATVSRLFDLDAPADTTGQKLAALHKLELANLELHLGAQLLAQANPLSPSIYGKGAAARQRAAGELLYVKTHILDVLQTMVVTAKAKRLVVLQLPALTGSYSPLNGQDAPAHFGPRPGQMDAFGLAAGIPAFHMIATPGFYERFSAVVGAKDPGFDMFGQDIESQLTEVDGDARAAERRALIKRIVLGTNGAASWLPQDPATIDIKSLFLANDRFHAGWDGNQGASARVIASGTAAVGDPEQVNRRIHAGMNDFIQGLPPPPYPFQIDVQAAARGKKTFEAARSCAGCHREKNEDIYSGQALGTDRNRANLLTETSRKGLILLFKQACKGEAWCEATDNDYMREIRSPEARGYKADMLHGIWAQAPYLHNGSVPTLWHMLHPSDRPATFVRGNINYDTEQVGFVWDRHVDQEEYDGARSRTYDTTLRGQSNAGHTYGADLSESSKRDLIEYLKSL